MTKQFRARWDKVEDTYHMNIALIIDGTIIEGASAIVFQEGSIFIGRLGFAENKHLDEDFTANTPRAAKAAVSKKTKAVFKVLEHRAHYSVETTQHPLLVVEEAA